MTPALALSEASVAVIIVAAIGAVATLGAGIANTVMLRRQRTEIDPRNGMRLGELVASIADRLFHHETKLDSIEVQVHEVIGKVEEVDAKIVGHIEDSRPLIEVFLKEHPELGKPTQAPGEGGKE